MECEVKDEIDMLRKKLSNIGYRVRATVATMDMGLQYDFITPTGAGTGFGGMGSWPFHRLKGINKEHFVEIKNKIRNAELAENDLSATSLGEFVAYYIDSNNIENGLSVFLQDLLKLPDELGNEFYCVCDAAAEDNAKFFKSYETALQFFGEKYCDARQCYINWQDADFKDLVEWENRLESDLSNTMTIDFGFAED